MAAAIADPVFRYGREGVELLQRAANDAIADLPDSERLRLGLSPIGTDRIFGPKTLHALKTLTNNGHARALLDAIAKRRLVRAHLPGDTVRAEHFRFP